MFVSDLLAGKRILVTGGGTGLGAAMAERFAALGADLVLCGRRPEPLADTAQRIGAATGREVETHRCDLRVPDAVSAMMDAVWAGGPLDVLVNNAAATFIARSERLSARAADSVIAPTLHGALYCTLEAGRRWIDARHPGTVLSILSTSTLTGRAFTMPSAVAKSGVLAMTKSLAVEWGRHGIRLVAIAPGPFPTPGATGQLGAGKREGRFAGDRIPLARVGEHAELANLASYLVSDQAGYITGEMITIDGGGHLRTSGAEDLLAWTDADWDAARPPKS